ncbi:MAG: hypothetical protein K1X67_15840 [Fimbriimonadaceae bacterium]|nr:hypothetical protein [Fimbriimonadaceae bacterium]
MLRNLSRASLVLGILPVTTAFAQDSILLRLKPKVGSVYVYQATQEVSMSGIGEPRSETSKSTLTINVLSSNSRAVKLQSSVSNIASPSKSASEVNGLKVTMTLSPLYKVLSASSSGGGKTGALMAKGMESAMRMTPQYPSKRLRVGDSWPIAIDLKNMLEAMGSGQFSFVGGSTINMRVSIARIERRNKDTFAHLKMTGSGRLSMEANKQRVPIEFSMNSTLLVDVATGMHYSMDMVVNEKIKVPTGTVVIKIRSETKLTKRTN